MSINYEAYQDRHSGRAKTVIPLMKSFLPLSWGDHIALLVLAVAPTVLIGRYAGIEGFLPVSPVFVAMIYLSLRIERSRRLYRDGPALEVSPSELVMPASHSPSGLERILPAAEVREIVFYKGAGRLRKVDTSVVFTDTGNRTFRISGLFIDLQRLRAALEKHGWDYQQRRNPKQRVHLAALGLIIAFSAYLFLQMM